MSFELLFLVSLVTGFVGVISGMGNGITLIPLLALLGIDIKQAIAVASLATIAASTTAASSYVRKHTPNLNVSAFLELFAVIGALTGALITVVSEQRLLFFLCGIVLLISWILLWKKGKEPLVSPLPQDAPSRWLELEGSYYDYAEGRTIAYQGSHAVFAAPLMLGTGVLSVLLGIGGNALTALIHEGVMGLPTKVSLSTSQLIVNVMVLAGAGVYLDAGLINLTLVPPVILGVTVGALVGSKLLLTLRSRVVRAIFLSLLIVLGVQMIARGIRGF